MLEQKSTGTVTWSCRSAQVRYQFAVMRLFIVTFHKSQTVLRTGVIGNILQKRYTLKPGLAFPQNLASPQNLAWHFWPGLRFGLLKNFGLKLKKGSLHIVSDFFHRIFIAFLGYWKLNAFFNTDPAEIPLPSRNLISASSAANLLLGVTTKIKVTNVVNLVKFVLFNKMTKYYPYCSITFYCKQCCMLLGYLVNYLLWYKS